MAVEEEVMVTYCPSHFYIVVNLQLDFDLDKVWDILDFNDDDEAIYTDVVEQMNKDLRGG